MYYCQRSGYCHSCGPFVMSPVSLLSSEIIAPYGAVAVLEAGLMLPVMEQFYTIQGEGYNTGRAAYFIRLGGCDVGCVWCDVKESWDADAHPRQSAAADI